MLAKIVFLVVILMPDGEFRSKTTIVDTCPSVKVIGDLYTQRMNRGEIIDWNASCFPMNFEMKEAT
jgi:hypothetical protein